MADTPDTSPAAGERIAKRLARAGLCSRRDAERLIAEGRVSVNGRVLDTPAVTVKPGDRVVVDGKAVPEPEPARLWRYHKPAGLVTTARDEKGRETVFDKLPPELPRVVSVGRLDLTSEGLLLLTNDGEMARYLEHPSTGWVRRYRVRVHGKPDEAALERLAKGVTVDGITYGPIEASLDGVQGANAWITVGLREGKNREVRKVMEHMGLTVNRLIRTAYGPFQLGKLDRGMVEEVPARVIRDQLRTFLSGQPEGSAANPTPAARPPKPRTGPPKRASAPDAARPTVARPTAARPTAARPPAGEAPRPPRPARTVVVRGLASEGGPREAGAGPGGGGKAPRAAAKPAAERRHFAGGRSWSDGDAQDAAPQRKPGRGAQGKGPAAGAATARPSGPRSAAPGRPQDKAPSRGQGKAPGGRSEGRADGPARDGPARDGARPGGQRSGGQPPGGQRPGEQRPGGQRPVPGRGPGGPKPGGGGPRTGPRGPRSGPSSGPSGPGRADRRR
jgi:23S rRNA pseudouridine2605 synthase